MSIEQMGTIGKRLGLVCGGGQVGRSEIRFMRSHSSLVGLDRRVLDRSGLSRRFLAVLAIGWCGWGAIGGSVVVAQEGGPSKPRELREGVVGVGLVEVEAVRKVASFPARVNMVEGNLEYTLVNPNGPVHEALLVTEARAEDIELGARLLGFSRDRKGRDEKGGTGNLTKDALQRAPKPEGVEVLVEVVWKGGDGVEKRSGLLDLLVRRAADGKPFSREGAWVYTGSKVMGNGVFLASGSGILGSMLLASEPLFVGTFEGNRDDSVWSPAKDLLPAVGTLVRVEMSAKPAR